MIIYFVETQFSEQRDLETALAGHDLRFVAELEDVKPDAEILCVYIHFVLDAAFLTAHPNLKLITTRSVGYDHIDTAECARRGVVVANVPGTDANTVAEHTFALILALSRRLQEVREANKRRHFRYDELRSFDLNDKNLGVIGTGRIGLHVIHIALAFGMKVLACDPYRPSLMAQILGVRYVSLDELLQSSHVISLHTPLTPETHHLLNRERLARCRAGALVVNTARGGLIDTDALVETLDSGRVAGAGLDVLDEESVMQRELSRIIADGMIRRLQEADTEEEESRMKYPDRIHEYSNLVRNQRLLARPDVVFTPHVAFNSVEAVQRINQMTVENINAFLKGSPINTGMAV